jgi:hypothetical protein
LGVPKFPFKPSILAKRPTPGVKKSGLNQRAAKRKIDLPAVKAACHQNRALRRCGQMPRGVREGDPQGSLFIEARRGQNLSPN